MEYCTTQDENQSLIPGQSSAAVLTTSTVTDPASMGAAFFSLAGSVTATILGPAFLVTTSLLIVLFGMGLEKESNASCAENWKCT
jgi:hypothetical protein